MTGNIQLISMEKFYEKKNVFIFSRGLKEKIDLHNSMVSYTSLTV